MKNFLSLCELFLHTPRYSQHVSEEVEKVETLRYICISQRSLVLDMFKEDVLTFMNRAQKERYIYYYTNTV